MVLSKENPIVNRSIEGPFEYYLWRLCPGSDVIEQVTGNDVIPEVTSSITLPLRMCDGNRKALEAAISHVDPLWVISWYTKSRETKGGNYSRHFFHLEFLGFFR